MDKKTHDPWQLVKSQQYQQAIVVYSRLYNEDGRPSHLFNRGLVRLLVGDYGSALEDFKLVTVIQEPKRLADGYYIFQGVCYWYLNQPSQAVDAWRQSLMALYTDAAGGVESPALLLYAAERLYDVELQREALQILKKHWRNYQRRQQRRQLRSRHTHEDFVHPGLVAWPGAIVPYLLEMIDDAQFEAEVEAARHETLRGRWQCQADFYVALRALREGDRETFRTRMTRCAESSYGYLEQEYYLARWEVQRSFPEPAFV